MTRDKWKYYPIDKSESANHDGLFMCFKNRFWVVENECLLFWGNSPQCNSNQELSKRCAKDGSKVVFIETAYIPCTERFDGVFFDI